MTKQALTTTDEVIDALGGTIAVARLVGRRAQAVSNWRGRVRGKFPPETYVLLTEALKRQGQAAPMTLWGMDQPQRRRA